PSLVKPGRSAPMAGTAVTGCQRNDSPLMNYHEGVGHGYEAGLLAPKRDYRRFDFGIITDRGRDPIYRQRPGGGFERTQAIFSTTGRGLRLEHDRHPSDARRS